jgi:pyridoxal/pyridoxine/pyridoxamine kinase
MTVISIQSQVAYGHVGNSAAVFPLQMHGIDASAIFAVLERTAISGTEEMRIVESAEQLVHPQRRFDAVAIGA